MQRLRDEITAQSAKIRSFSSNHSCSNADMEDVSRKLERNIKNEILSKKKVSFNLD